MVERGIAGATRNRYRSAVSQLYAVAMRPRYRQATGVKENPMRGVERDTEQGRTVVLSLPQLRAILAQCSRHLWLTVMVAAMAPALRVGSILRLRWDQHIDADVRLITVAQHKTARRIGRPLVMPISDDLRRVLLAVRQTPRAAREDHRHRAQGRLPRRGRALRPGGPGRRHLPHPSAFRADVPGGAWRARRAAEGRRRPHHLRDGAALYAPRGASPGRAAAAAGGPPRCRGTSRGTSAAPSPTEGAAGARPARCERTRSRKTLGFRGHRAAGDDGQGPQNLVEVSPPCGFDPLRRHQLTGCSTWNVGTPHSWDRSWDFAAAALTRPGGGARRPTPAAPGHRWPRARPRRRR